MYKLLSMMLLAFMISGCGLLDPLVYKITKQQGNFTEEKHVKQLEIGMSKEQVKFLLGTPMSIDSFDHDRWDYIYTYQDGNDKVTRNNITIRFENEKLISIDGEAFIKDKDPLSKKAGDEDGEDEEGK